jgi:hypothetical protein
MPFKMIANRSVYRIDDGKEYQKGESFTVAAEKDRDRLIRTKRASLDEAKATQTKSTKRAEPVVQKVMTLESAVAASQDDVVVAEPQSELPKPNRYRRSDMRAED